MRDRKLAWRNAAVDWHLKQELPLDCGCDDDTPEDALCAPSRSYADALLSVYLPEPGGGPEGPADPWQHDVWVAAWGRNAPLILSGLDLPGMPRPPAGMSWLATRLLVGGRRAVELALLRLGGDRMATLARARLLPDPEAIAERARKMLQRLSD